MDTLEELSMVIREKLGFDQRDPKHMQMLNEAMAATGAKRWHAVDRLLWALNPVGHNPETGEKTEDYRNIRRHIAASVVAARGELIDKKFGRTEDSLSDSKGGVKSTNTRHALRMPETLIRYIQLLDPTVMTGTPQERRDSVHELMQAFPEFRIAKEI